MNKQKIRLVTGEDERREICNFTISRRHIWRSVLTNSEDVKRKMQGIVMNKCFACGIVDDVPNYAQE